MERKFEVPEGERWIYAASPTLLTTVCGDCRLWFKAQLREVQPRAWAFERESHDFVG